MVRATALALMLAAGPWQAYEEPAPDWSVQTTGGTFSIYNSEIDTAYDGTGPGFALWIHGDHSNSKLVTYRSSLWRYFFDCRGYIRILASTTYRADGSKVQDWDGMAQLTAIRPGTIFQKIERDFCNK